MIVRLYESESMTAPKNQIMNDKYDFTDEASYNRMAEAAKGGIERGKSMKSLLYFEREEERGGGRGKEEMPQLVVLGLATRRGDGVAPDLSVA